jgi:adenylate kinase family enzyme
MRNIEKLTIVMGLPGSGKTTLAEKMKEESSSKDIFVLHLDEIREKHNFWRKEYQALEYIRNGMEDWRGQPHVVLDGLFLTNTDLFHAMTMFTEYAYGVLEITIHRFDADRDACLKNDGGRREKKSTNTILNAKYEDVDIAALNDRLQKYGAKNMKVVKVMDHDVVLKPDWIRYYKSHVDFGKDGKLRSDKWSLGGEHGSCYGGRRYSDGEEPLDFAELDDLLDEKCPDLKYKDYRAIKEKCISTEETCESEYYGGYTNYMNWVCDLKKMYDMLTEMGYIMAVD